MERQRPPASSPRVGTVILRRLDDPCSGRHLVASGGVHTDENIGVLWLKPSYWRTSFRAVVCLLTIRKIPMSWICCMISRKISFRKPRILRAERDTPTASNLGRIESGSELRLYFGPHDPLNSSQTDVPKV